MRTIKWIILIAALSMALGLSSCSPYIKFGSSDMIADKLFQQITSALNEKKPENLKNLFSPNALKEADDLDGGIKYLMGFYQGEILSKKRGLNENGSNDHGKKTIELRCRYTVTTDVDDYIVFFIYNKIDTENKDNIGLYMLQIIKKVDEDQQFDWGGKKTRRAGIYRPPVTTE